MRNDTGWACVSTLASGPHGWACVSTLASYWAGLPGENWLAGFRASGESRVLHSQRRASPKQEWYSNYERKIWQASHITDIWTRESLVYTHHSHEQSRCLRLRDGASTSRVAVQELGSSWVVGITAPRMCERTIQFGPSVASCTDTGNHSAESKKYEIKCKCSRRL